ncbi:MAG TPA: tetratricopeptide repeat protein, partial [Chitinophagaceae bacterium]|nr:tetratricopeptide repeat protein [Chitinophagaceae bacterium]
SQQHEKAISDFEKALSYYSDSPKDKAKLYGFIADSKSSLKNTDGALEYYSKSVDTDPGYKSSYEKRAGIWADKKEYAKAKADIGKALQYSSEDVLGNYFDYSLYQKRSLYHYYLGEYEDGIRDAMEALKTDSSMTTYWRLGINYDGSGKLSQSVSAYRKAIAKAKDSTNRAILTRNISLVYKKMLDYRSAIKEINTAITYRKNYKDAYWTRAEILIAMKQYSAALTDYDQCLKLYTESSSLASIYKERAELEYKTKDYDRAYYDYKKLLELFPENVNYLYNAGRFLVQSKKDPAEGKDKLEKAATLDLGIDTCSDYSYSKLFLGDITGAINNNFRLIDKYRNDPYQYKWKLHLQCCIYSLSGNIPKAMEYMEKSLAAGFDDFDHLYTDRDLESIKNLPQYKALLAKYKSPVPKL